MKILKRHLSLVLLTSLLLATGCAKKECGKPLDEVPKDISDLEWRLVSSTDPQTSSSLTRFNFLVFKFESGFTGIMKKAQNNILQEDEQAKRFLYAAIPYTEDGLCIDYLNSPTEIQARMSSGENFEELCQGDSENLRYYTYRLDRWGLKLQGEAGDTYHFCPFEGAFSPLSQDSWP